MLWYAARRGTTSRENIFKLDTQICLLDKNATFFVILDKQDFKWLHHELIAWMCKDQNSFEVVIAHKCTLSMLLYVEGIYRSPAKMFCLWWFLTCGLLQVARILLYVEWVVGSVMLLTVFWSLRGIHESVTLLLHQHYSYFCLHISLELIMSLDKRLQQSVMIWHQFKHATWTMYSIGNHKEYLQYWFSQLKHLCLLLNWS